MSPKRTLLALTLLLSLTSTLPTYAWGFVHIIPPGSHVFDAKRFQDSVKETAQMVQEYLQEVDKWKKKVLLMTGVTDLDKRIDTAVKQFETQFNGQSILAPDNTLESTPMRQHMTNEYVATQFTDYRNLLLDEERNANLDAVRMAQGILNRYDTRYQQLLDISSIDTPGEVGERQKGTAIAALHALNTEDMIRLSAAETLRQVTADDAAAAQETAELRANGVSGFRAYDPYHPTAYDQENAPAIENMGFLSTKQTE